MTTSSLASVIPWLAHFQRGRGVEGDVMILGLGDWVIMRDLVLTEGGDRLVVVDEVDIHNHLWLQSQALHRELVIINENPRDVLGTEAMTLEHGGYRMVAINGSHEEDLTHDLLREAALLICPGGLVLLTPWPGDPEVDRGVAMGYWEYMRTHAKPLMRCGHEGQTLLLTNDRVWQRDYESVITAAKGSDDVREV
jgi:hypothetical protein